MKDRPEGVTEDGLVGVLADGWGLRVRSVEYRPVGAGSYHWTAVADDGSVRFVTVDDLGAEDGHREARFAELRRAFDTALALCRDARLDFVVAPLVDRAGASVRRLDPRYAVTVFPMVDGQAGQFGPHPVADRVGLAVLLAELHQATPAVAAVAPRADLVLPGRDRLRAALDGLDREWTGGPFSEPARRLLAARADHVERLLADIACYVDDLRRPHRESADTAAWWGYLRGYLA